LLLMLVVMAMLVWALGLRRRPRAVLAALSAAALLWLGWSVGPHVTRVSSDLAGAATPTAVAGVSWEPWSEARQAELLAAGRPVFVDFTAAWCVTCQYNKRTTLSDEGVLADFGERQVALLRADWTRRDPQITAELARLGRNGVPVYALYKNGQPTVVLSEILSVEEVRATLASL
ncbi:MAG: protein-disulfide reductase, partial [Burkholderiales bacterium]